MFVTANFELFKRWRGLLIDLQRLSSIVQNTYELDPAAFLLWQKQVDQLVINIKNLKTETIAYIKGQEVEEVQEVENRKKVITETGLVLPTRLKRG